jgi:NADP-dependent 3-hydroxy acid dehydrogenase YdfG
VNHIANTVTVITGASSGIGAATAKRLASDGSRVVLAARNEDKLAALVREITDAGGTATYRVTDVTNADELLALVEFAIATYGRVDTFVNNAGLMLFSYWKDAATDDWQKMIDTNIHGYLNAIAAVLPKMIAQGHGHILNMSSVAGHSTGEANGVYASTKFFIRGITESLRKEVSPETGIQVSMVSPGVIDTGWTDKVDNADGKKVAEQLVEAAITPEQVANAVAFALNQPADVAINEIIVAPTKQPW